MNYYDISVAHLRCLKLIIRNDIVMSLWSDTWIICLILNTVLDVITMQVKLCMRLIAFSDCGEL